MGDCPKYIDVKKSSAIRELYNSSDVISFKKQTLIDALDKHRHIEIRNSNGTLADNLLYNLKEDGWQKWLFIAQGVKTVHKDVVKPQNVIIKIKGEHSVSVYDTIGGKVHGIEHYVKGGNTYVSAALNCHDSLLLCLDGEIAKLPPQKEEKTVIAAIDFRKSVPYTLSEPNVLLLDIAEYALDEGEFMPEEEILRANNILREGLGWPKRGNAIAHPWVIKEEKSEHTIRLRFRINSEIDVPAPMLAAENPQDLKIVFNGSKVPVADSGYYVDEAIRTLPLPPIRVGENTLEVSMPFGKRTNTEYFYILGDFGVNVHG